MFMSRSTPEQRAKDAERAEQNALLEDFFCNDAKVDACRRLLKKELSSGSANNSSSCSLRSCKSSSGDSSKSMGTARSSFSSNEEPRKRTVRFSRSHSSKRPTLRRKDYTVAERRNAFYTPQEIEGFTAAAKELANNKNGSGSSSSLGDSTALDDSSTSSILSNNSMRSFGSSLARSRAKRCGLGLPAMKKCNDTDVDDGRGLEPFSKSGIKDREEQVFRAVATVLRAQRDGKDAAKPYRLAVQSSSKAAVQRANEYTAVKAAAAATAVPSTTSADCSSEKNGWKAKIMANKRRIKGLGWRSRSKPQ